jgi:Na+/proline symporter
MSEKTEQALGVLAVVAAALMFTLLYVFGIDTVSGFVSGDLEFIISVVFLGTVFGYLAWKQL